MALVSSNCFGLRILCSGLTQHEVRQLINIKIFGTIVLENVPQIILQSVYANDRGFDTNVTIAFSASILSIVTTLISYYHERPQKKGIEAVEYFLTIEREQLKKRGRKTTRADSITSNDTLLTVKKGRTSSMESIQSVGTVISDTATVISDAPTAISAGGTMYSRRLNKKEKNRIMRKRGRRKALGLKLAEIYEIKPKFIEIGTTLIHKYGAIVHVVHFVNESKVDELQLELIDEGVSVNPFYYAKKLFDDQSEKITDLCRRHFKLGGDFVVHCNNFAAIKRRKMTSKMKKAKSLNQSQRRLLTEQANDKKNGRNNIRSDIERYFDYKAGEFNVAKETLYQMIEKIERKRIGHLGVIGGALTQIGGYMKNKRNSKYNDNAYDYKLLEDDIKSYLNTDDDEFSVMKNELYGMIKEIKQNKANVNMENDIKDYFDGQDFGFVKDELFQMIKEIKAQKSEKEYKEQREENNAYNKQIEEQKKDIKKIKKKNIASDRIKDIEEQITNNVVIKKNDDNKNDDSKDDTNEIIYENDSKKDDNKKDESNEIVYENDSNKKDGDGDGTDSEDDVDNIIDGIAIDDVMEILDEED